MLQVDAKEVMWWQDNGNTAMWILNSKPSKGEALNGAECSAEPAEPSARLQTA